MTAGLPEPTRLAVTAGTVLVLRLPASAWGDQPEELLAAVEHLHQQTGAVVVVLDADGDVEKLSAVQRADAVEALADALTEAHIAAVPDEELPAAVLDGLAEAGWRLLRLDQ